MSVAVFMQSREMAPGEYDSVNEKLGDEPPEGLLARTAGQGAGGFCVFSVWESEEHYERFRQERLLPAVREVIGAEAAEGPSSADVYELHDVYIKPEGAS